MGSSDPLIDLLKLSISFLEACTFLVFANHCVCVQMFLWGLGGKPRGIRSSRVSYLDGFIFVLDI